MRKHNLLPVLFLLANPLLLADTGLNDNLTAGLLKSSGMLLVVIAVILALAWLLKKSQTMTTGLQKNIQLVETLALGRNEKLCLVRCGNRYLLIGVTASGIQTLTEIPSEDVQNPTDTKEAWQWAQQYLRRHENN